MHRRDVARGRARQRRRGGGPGALGARVHRASCAAATATPPAGSPRPSCTSSAEDTFGHLLHVLRPAVGVAAATASRDGRARDRAAAGALGDGHPLFSPRRRIARAEGWALLRGGHLDARARRSLIDAPSVRGHAAGFAALLLYEALRAGAPTPDRAAGAARRAALRRGLIAAYAAHAEALAARDGDALMAPPRSSRRSALHRMRWTPRSRGRGVPSTRAARTPPAAPPPAPATSMSGARARRRRRSTASTHRARADAARGPARRPRRQGFVERRDRRPARAVRPHGRDAPLPRDAEAERQRPTGSLATGGCR